MRNEGTADRVIRLLLGIGLVIVSWFVLGLSAGGVLAIVVAAIGAVLVVTGLVGFCPAYRLLGVRTCSIDTTGA